jgi:hypothetical protein
VTANPLLTAPDGLRRIWFSLDSPSQYFPLTHTDAETLWRTTIARNPGARMAYDNLDIIPSRRGKMDGAMALFQKLTPPHAQNESAAVVGRASASSSERNGLSE